MHVSPESRTTHPARVAVPEKTLWAATTKPQKKHQNNSESKEWHNRTCECFLVISTVRSEAQVHNSYMITTNFSFLSIRST